MNYVTQVAATNLLPYVRCADTETLPGSGASGMRTRAAPLDVTAIRSASRERRRR